MRPTVPFDCHPLCLSSLLLCLIFPPRQSSAHACVLMCLCVSFQTLYVIYYIDKTLQKLLFRYVHVNIKGIIPYFCSLLFLMVVVVQWYLGDLSMLISKEISLIISKHCMLFQINKLVYLAIFLWTVRFFPVLCYYKQL